MEEDMGAAAAAEEGPHRLMKFRRNHHVGSLLLKIIVIFFLSLQQSQPTMVRALAAQQTEKPATRISFGSCANQSAPQPIWDAVLEFDPTVFIWLGDNIYADVKEPNKLFGKKRTVGPFKNVPRFWPITPEEMKEKYNLLKTQQPGYVALQNKTQIIGTWDDHDYGLNDAGKEYDGKDFSQQLMLDFLDEPSDSLRRKQQGVYASYTYGPAGKRVKVILLDTRYHRDPMHSDGTILGEVQWKWLESELRNSDAQIHIFGSSIQVVSNFSAMSQPFFHVESWSMFPTERNKLYDLLRDTNTSGAIFISGDVHFGEIARFDCGLTYPIYDITSSGLTQAVEEEASAIFSYVLALGAWLLPHTMRVRNSRCTTSSCVYGYANFGTFTIDWDANPVTINAEVRDVHGVPKLGQTITLPELQPGYFKLQSSQTKSTQRHCTLESELPWYRKYILAITFIGTIIVLVAVLLALVGGGVIFLRSLQSPRVKED